MASDVLNSVNRLQPVLAWLLVHGGGAGLQAAPGALHPAGPVELRAEAWVMAAAVEADGRTLVGGDFWWLDGVVAPGLARLDAMGLRDPVFVPAVGLAPELLTAGYEAAGGLTMQRVTLLPLTDGRTWVELRSAPNPWTVLGPQGQVAVGGLTTLPAEATTQVHAEGTVNGGIVVSLVARPAGVAEAGEVRALALDDGRTLWSHAVTGAPVPQRAWPAGDGRWWIAGDDYTPDPDIPAHVPGTAKRIWRINGDGTMDGSLTPMSFPRGFTHVIEPMSQRRLAVLATDMRVLQYTGYHDLFPVEARIFASTGLVADTFTSSQRSRFALRVAASAGGLLTTLGTEPSHLRRLATDGTDDQSFTRPPMPEHSALVALPDGGFHIGAGRHLADGTPDPAWHRPSARRPARTHALAPAPAGGVFAAGDFVTVNGNPGPGVIRLRADGTPAPEFSADPALAGSIMDVRSLPDGRVYILEVRGAAALGVSRSRVVRLRSDGALDTGFAAFEGRIPHAVPGVGVTTRYIGEVLRFAIFPDGSILVLTRDPATELSSLAWRGLAGTGEVDPSFKLIHNPPEVAPLVMPDGKFWLLGQRYLRDGTKEFTLPATSSSNTPPCLLSDGRVVFKVSGGGLRAVLPSGAWDESFFVPIPPASVDMLAPGERGGLYVRYTRFGVREWDGVGLRRLHGDGRADATFRSDPLARRPLPDGVVTQGLNWGGVFDLTETTGLGSETLTAVLAVPNGVWLAGNFTHVAGRRRDGLALLATDVAAGYEAWAAAVFRLEPPPTPDQRPGGDPDHDGAPNALEYATGTDPLASDAVESQLHLLSHQPLCYTLPRNRDAPEMVPVVEVSSGLDGWRTATATDIRLKGEVGAVAFEIQPTSAARFVRVRFVGDL